MLLKRLKQSMIFKDLQSSIYKPGSHTLRNIRNINVGGELLLGGAYSDSVFRSNSDFSDLYTSIKRRL